MIAVAALLFARRPFALLHPQFYAEDGAVFWLDDYLIGWRAFFNPYSGYLHLAPRLVAWASGLFDPLHAPERYYYAALLAHLAVIAALFSPRVPLPGKPALALCTVLVPHTNEVFTNLTNIQWPLALGQVLLLVAADAASPGTWTFDLAAMVLLGLTGPFSVLLLPAFALRAFRRRTRASRWLALACGAAAAVQAWELLRGQPPIDAGSHPPGELVFALPVRVWGTLLAGFRLTDMTTPAVWLSLGGGATAVFATVMLRPGPWREARIQIFCSWLLLVGSVAVKNLHLAGELLHPLNGDRYFYLIHVLALWGLILWFAGTRSAWRWLPLTVAVLAAAMGLPQFVEPARPIMPWASEMPLIRSGAPFDIPTLPEGIDIPSPGKAVAAP